MKKFVLLILLTGSILLLSQEAFAAQGIPAPLCIGTCFCSSNCFKDCTDNDGLLSSCGEWGKCVTSPSCTSGASCSNQSCTNWINGTASGDTLFGTSANDCIDGLAGNDTIDGGSGDDRIHGNDGTDTLYGNSGHDCLWGDSGNDHLDGQSGTDFADGGGGTDTCYAESKVNCP